MISSYTFYSFLALSCFTNLVFYMIMAGFWDYLSLTIVASAYYILIYGLAVKGLWHLVATKDLDEYYNEYERMVVLTLTGVYVLPNICHVLPRLVILAVFHLTNDNPFVATPFAFLFSLCATPAVYLWGLISLRGMEVRAGHAHMQVQNADLSSDNATTLDADIVQWYKEEVRTSRTNPSIVALQAMRSSRQNSASVCDSDDGVVTARNPAGTSEGDVGADSGLISMFDSIPTHHEQGHGASLGPCMSL